MALPLYRHIARHLGVRRQFEYFLDSLSVIRRRMENDRGSIAIITLVYGLENYKIPSLFSKTLRVIRINFVSYNQKKFDTRLSFLIPSDASNLTNCSLRNRFRSSFFRFRRTAVLAAGRLVRAVRAGDIPMHFIGRLPAGSGPKDRTE
ncbi:hypothetical protein ACVBGC_04015 [Burkholderia stagnalis]